jgi:hypothetical protein
VSATGRGAVREPDDFYTTPSWAVRRLIEAWRPRLGAIVEPSAGNGAIIRAANAVIPELAPRWFAYEIREEERETLGALCNAVIGNFLTDTTVNAGGRDFSVKTVLGNPPFSKAWEFVHEARRRFPTAEVCYLLRLAFAASADRAPFMRECPPDVFVVPDRISFDGVGADSADYGWFVFPPAVPGATRSAGAFRVLNTTPLAERKLDRGHAVLIEDAQTRLAL